jgi:hypothetical protein
VSITAAARYGAAAERLSLSAICRCRWWMRTRTEQLLFHLGFSLAVLVLAVFVTLVAGVVVTSVALLGGIAGWTAGVVLGALVAQATRRPVGLLMGRLVDAAG